MFRAQFFFRKNQQKTENFNLEIFENRKSQNSKFVIFEIYGFQKISDCFSRETFFDPGKHLQRLYHL